MFEFIEQFKFVQVVVLQLDVQDDQGWFVCLYGSKSIIGIGCFMWFVFVVFQQIVNQFVDICFIIYDQDVVCYELSFLCIFKYGFIFFCQWEDEFDNCIMVFFGCVQFKMVFMVFYDVFYDCEVKFCVFFVCCYIWFGQVFLVGNWLVQIIVLYFDYGIVVFFVQVGCDNVWFGIIQIVLYV